MPGRTRRGDALTDLVLPAFELNGEFLEAAAMITTPHNLTPAQWQVLGAALREPRPVAEIARTIGLGLTRQSVQRVANDVVERGWAQWSDNPHHQRAKLLSPTDSGRLAVSSMARDQHAWANAVGGAFTAEELRTLRALIDKAIAASRGYRQSAAADTGIRRSRRSTAAAD